MGLRFFIPTYYRQHRSDAISLSTFGVVSCVTLMLRSDLQASLNSPIHVSCIEAHVISRMELHSCCKLKITKSLHEEKKAKRAVRVITYITLACILRVFHLTRPPLRGWIRQYPCPYSRNDVDPHTTACGSRLAGKNLNQSLRLSRDAVIIEGGLNTRQKLTLEAHDLCALVGL